MKFTREAADVDVDVEETPAQAKGVFLQLSIHRRSQDFRCGLRFGALKAVDSGEGLGFR